MTKQTERLAIMAACAIGIVAMPGYMVAVQGLVERPPATVVRAIASAPAPLQPILGESYLLAVEMPTPIAPIIVAERTWGRVLLRR